MLERCLIRDNKKAFLDMFCIMHLIPLHFCIYGSGFFLVFATGMCMVGPEQVEQGGWLYKYTLSLYVYLSLYVSLSLSSLCVQMHSYNIMPHKIDLFLEDWVSKGIYVNRENSEGQFR